MVTASAYSFHHFRPQWCTWWPCLSHCPPSVCTHHQLGCSGRVYCTLAWSSMTSLQSVVIVLAFAPFSLHSTSEFVKNTHSWSITNSVTPACNCVSAYLFLRTEYTHAYSTYRLQKKTLVQIATEVYHPSNLNLAEDALSRLSRNT